MEVKGFPYLQEKDVFTQFSSFIPMQNRYRRLSNQTSSRVEEIPLPSILHTQMYVIFAPTQISKTLGCDVNPEKI